MLTIESTHNIVKLQSIYKSSTISAQKKTKKVFRFFFILVSDNPS